MIKRSGKSKTPSMKSQIECNRNIAFLSIVSDTRKCRLKTKRKH